MKTITLSTIIAGLTAGVVTLWYSNPVKKLKDRAPVKKVSPKKEKQTADSSDHLFI
ncbi:MAG: hypothetical protein RJQ09_06520 [Cyclobacteriaceae bacterium]